MRVRSLSHLLTHSEKLSLPCLRACICLSLPPFLAHSLAPSLCLCKAQDKREQMHAGSSFLSLFLSHTHIHILTHSVSRSLFALTLSLALSLSVSFCLFLCAYVSLSHSLYRSLTSLSLSL
jgi:hypothetical protein